jgi:hypothetical protein
MFRCYITEYSETRVSVRRGEEASTADMFASQSPLPRVPSNGSREI